MQNLSSRLKKAKLNILWSAIYQVVNFVCKMILPPMIILTYGSAYNGMVASITQCMSVVSILRLGVAGAYRVALYTPLAEGDETRISSIVKSVEAYMRKICVVIGFYILILMVIYPTYIATEYAWGEVALLVLALGLVTFAEFYFGFTYEQFLDAKQLTYISKAVQTGTNIVNTIVSVVLIWLGESLQLVKCVGSAIFFLQPMLLRKYVAKEYRIQSDIAPDSDALKIRSAAMGHSIANIIHDNIDVIALSLFANITSVSVYSVYRSICSGLQSLLMMGATGLEAAFGNMWAKGEMENIREKIRLFEYLVSLFVSIVISSAGVMMLPFIALYTKGASDVEYVLPLYAFLAVAAYGIWCFEAPYRIIIQAAGRYQETKIGRYWQAGINLALTLVLVKPFGIYGVVIGTLIANIFGVGQFIWYTCRNLLTVDVWQSIGRIAWAGMNTILVYAICTPLVDKFAYESWSSWILCGVGTVVIGAILAIGMSWIFYKDNLHNTVHLVGRMGGRVARKD